MPTPATQEFYLDKAVALRRAAAKRRGLECVSWGVVVDDLIAGKARLTSATWKLYRVALTAAIEADIAKGPHDSLLLLVALDLASTGKAGCIRKSTQTSALKEKIFPIGDRLKIYEALALSRSPVSKPLNDFIRAACSTGVRTCEWRDARVCEPEPGFLFKILIKNAKKDAVRGHGEYRTMRWPTISIDLKQSITATIYQANTSQTVLEYKKFLKLLQANLWSLCKKIWIDKSKHYALASCRHQFTAVARGIRSPEDVATLLGHSTDETHAAHYGKMRKSGSKDSKLKIVSVTDETVEVPVADPIEVARVRRRLAVRLEKFLNFKLAGPYAYILDAAIEPLKTNMPAPINEFVDSDFPTPEPRLSEHPRTPKILAIPAAHQRLDFKIHRRDDSSLLSPQRQGAPRDEKPAPEIDDNDEYPTYRS